MKLYSRLSLLYFIAIGVCCPWFANQSVAQESSLYTEETRQPSLVSHVQADFNPYLQYRFTNQFLGEGRSLDVYGDGDNAPFMGTTGNFRGQYWKITSLENGYYRLSNQFLGEDRSLDVYGDGDNAPFMGTTGNFRGQYWKITSLENGYYRLSNQFLGEDRSLDVYGDGDNAPFMGTTGNFRGQYWKITPLPPFSGTIFINPNLITSNDPTLFQSTTYMGRGMRVMFDRRVNTFITLNAYLFNATFSDGRSIEVQVNPEFNNSINAQFEAEKYAKEIGRLPTVLRTDVQTVWIHKGVELFGGGNNNILIHTGQGENYSKDGILEEVLIHEASHTSLDAYHASATGWLRAQLADPVFISTYAQDNPMREDIAESFLTYIAIRYRSNRISQSLANIITHSIPNRIAYFDAQLFDMHPITKDPQTHVKVFLPFLRK